MSNCFFYKKSGHGEKSIILFHGFGQDHRVFDKYIPLSTGYTLYAIDLFYHGKSERGNENLTKKEWLHIFQTFLSKENIEQFSLLGFSLGGRFVLATAMAFPEKTERVILIAPDGIYRNFWYRVATSQLGNILFKKLMLGGGLSEKWLRRIEWMKLTSPSQLKFARKELMDPDNRKKIYRSWTYFKPLFHRAKSVVTGFNNHHLPLYLILGEKDRIIPAEQVIPKVKQMQTLETHIIPYRHHHLISGSGKLISEILHKQMPSKA